MKEHETRSKGEELLTRVLEECLEEDLSFVPPEGEIARTHRFSREFEQRMQEILEGMSAACRKKEIRRHFSPRLGQWAACILIFCVCGWLFVQVGGQIGGFDTKETAEEAPASETAEEEAVAAEDAPAEDMGTGSADTVTQEDPDNFESGPDEGQAVKEYCGQEVSLASQQKVQEQSDSVTTRLNCPVLDEDNPVLMLTIGNTGEENIRYYNRYDLEVWLEDAWYRIPPKSEEAGEWLILEAGMAVDEEVDLSLYQIDHDARQYRLVTRTEQGRVGIEFTFEEVFKETMETDAELKRSACLSEAPEGFQNAKAL